MNLTSISATISHALNVGSYESIKPSVSITADLEEGDEVKSCFRELHKEAGRMWAESALKELSWVEERRNEKNKHEFTETTKATRNQLKKMLV
jgi:hypothetical protein